MKRIWRKVVNHSYFLSAGTRHSGPQWVLELECGHKDFRPASKPIPQRVICITCENEAAERCANCGQLLDLFPARNANQRCPTKKEIRQGRYD